MHIIGRIQTGLGGLGGAGVAATGMPAVNLNTSSLKFVSHSTGTASAAQTVTLKNSGTSTLTLRSVQLTGGQADDYQLTSTCGEPLAAGESCTLSVTFKPVSAGFKTASISIADNANGSPQVLGLTGTGSGSGGTSGLSYTLSQHSIALASSTDSSTYSTMTIYYTIHNWSKAPQTGFIVTPLTSTGAAISSSSATSLGVTGPPPASDEATGSITVNFWNPSLLGAGTYIGSLTFSVCYNPAMSVGCDQMIAGPPTTIPVTYTVTGAARPTTTAAVYQGPVNLEAPQTATAGPSRDLGVTLSNDGPGPFVTFSQPPNGFVSNVSYADIGPNSGTLTIGYIPPGSLALGKHTESLTVNKCVDLQCQHPLANNPFAIAMSYQVTAASGVSYNAITVPMEAVDVVWSAPRAKLYAVVSQYSPQLAQSLLEIDPQTGAIERTLAHQGNPASLVVSDDGAYIYIAYCLKNIVERIALSEFIVDIDINLGGTTQSGPILPVYLLAVANQPHSVVVSTSRTRPNLTGLPIPSVYVYDDTTARATTFVSTTLSQLAEPIVFGTDPALLYAVEDQFETLYSATASSAGLALTASVTTAPNAPIGPLSFANGLIDDFLGHVTDPSNGKAYGGFLEGEFGAGASTYDAPLNRAYFFSDYSVDDNGEWSIGTFNLKNHDSVAILREPADFIDYDGVSNTRIVRWGTNGLALIGPHSLQILSGSFVTQ